MGIEEARGTEDTQTGAGGAAGLRISAPTTRLAGFTFARSQGQHALATILARREKEQATPIGTMPVGSQK
jgi:hypothetical protein